MAGREHRPAIGVFRGHGVSEATRVSGVGVNAGRGARTLMTTTSVQTGATSVQVTATGVQMTATGVQETRKTLGKRKSHG